jgi:hypothetical protein
MATLLDEPKTLLFFGFQRGMPISDHAAQGCQGKRIGLTALSGVAHWFMPC